MPSALRPPAVSSNAPAAAVTASEAGNASSGDGRKVHTSHATLAASSSAK